MIKAHNQETSNFEGISLYQDNIVMSCPKKYSEYSFNHLRNEYLICKQELKHYKYLFRNECLKTKSLHRNLTQITKESNVNQLKVQELRRKLKNVNDLYDKLPLTRKRKSWSKIKSDQTKHQRVSQYGKFVFSTIKDNIPQCKQAQLCLCLGDKTVNYAWKSKDFTLTNSQNMKSYPDIEHSYAAKPIEKYSNDEDNLIDVDYSEIFDFGRKLAIQTQKENY